MRLLALLLLPCVASAQPQSFLREPLGSRGVTLPPESTAIVDEATALSINPGALRFVGSSQLIYVHERNGVRDQVGNGLFKDEITLYTNDPASATIPISVTANVQSAVTVSPKIINLGTVRPGDSQGSSIRRSPVASAKAPTTQAQRNAGPAGRIDQSAKRSSQESRVGLAEVVVSEADILDGIAWSLA